MLIRTIAAAALILGAAAVLLRRGWPLARYRVDGPSMEPAYREGDRLLVNRLAYVLSAPRPGDAIVLRDPEHPERLLLKRVASVPPGDCADCVFVVGDNPPASRDSRQFGPIPRASVIGRAWRRY